MWLLWYVLGIVTPLLVFGLLYLGAAALDWADDRIYQWRRWDYNDLPEDAVSPRYLRGPDWIALTVNREPGTIFSFRIPKWIHRVKPAKPHPPWTKDF